MKLFKQNPVFSALLSLIILLFIGGIVMFFLMRGQAETEKKAVSRAESQLKLASALEPAPTAANIEAAEANVKVLQAELDKRIQSTLGKKPTLMKGKAPTNGTQMLFQLRAYRNEFNQVANRTIPIDANLSDEEIAEMRENGEPMPSTKIPDGFSFGFSRYIDSGNPPKDEDVAVIFQQNEILTYILRKLFNTNPIAINEVKRGPVELPKQVVAKPNSNNRNANQGLMADEFRIGSESARVEGAVETLAFEVVFTGYTVNLREFLKQLEEFEVPLVVRSVEVVPLEDGVKLASAPAAPAPASPFDIFGTVPNKDATADVVEEPESDPIVEENISQFSVVLEYITVDISREEKAADGEEDLS